MVESEGFRNPIRHGASPGRHLSTRPRTPTLTDWSMEEIGGDAPACEHRAVRNLGASALWGLAIGSSLVVGAVVAARTSLPPAVAELVTAFGGGVLLAAIALGSPAPPSRTTRFPLGRNRGICCLRVLMDER